MSVLGYPKNIKDYFSHTSKKFKKSKFFATLSDVLLDFLNFSCPPIETFFVHPIPPIPYLINVYNTLKHEYKKLSKIKSP